MAKKTIDKKLSRLYEQKDKRWREIEDFDKNSGKNPDRLVKKAAKTDKKISRLLSKNKNTKTYHRND